MFKKRIVREFLPKQGAAVWRSWVRCLHVLLTDFLLNSKLKSLNLLVRITMKTNSLVINLIKLTQHSSVAKFLMIMEVWLSSLRVLWISEAFCVGTLEIWGTVVTFKGLSLCSQSRSCVHILCTKLSSFSSTCLLPFCGQDLKAQLWRGDCWSTFLTLFDKMLPQVEEFIYFTKNTNVIIWMLLLNINCVVKIC